MKKALIVGAVVVVVAAAGGFAAVRFLEQPSEDAAVALVPSDSWVYANLFIEPSGDQKRALDDLLSKFPGIESTDEAINRLTELLDRELEGVGLSYEEDFEPWVGDQVSIFFSGESFDPPDGAGLLETTDPEAAQDAIDKLRESEGAPEPEQKTYSGIDYTLEDAESDVPIAVGFVEDFLVIGTEGGFKSVVDTSEAGEEEALAGSEEFEAAFQGLEEANILSVYLDQGRLFELLEQSGEFTGQEAAALNAFPGFQNVGAGGFVLSARSDGVSLESSSAMPEGEEVDALAGLYEGTDVIRSLPADAWAAFGVPNLGDTASALIDMVSEMPGAENARAQANQAVQAELGLDLEEDILSWMGDTAFFVQGTNFQEMSGGMVMESDDPDATRTVLDKVRGRIEAQQVPTSDEQRGDYEGFSIQAGLPAPISALVADRLVVTYGEKATEAAVEPDETLGDDATFQTASDALGDDYQPSFYVDMTSVLELVDFARGFSGETDDTYEQDVKPWLDPLSYVVAGSRRDGDRIYQSFFVGVEEEESP